MLNYAWKTINIKIVEYKSVAQEATHIAIKQSVIYLMFENISAQGWRSLVKRDGLKIRWLRSTGVQKYEQISLPAHLSFKLHVYGE